MTWPLVAAAVALDLLLGDPRWAPHPVRAIGWWIARVERTTRRLLGATRWAGVVLWLAVVGATTAVVYLLPRWLDLYWAYSLLAIGSLDRESRRVVRLLDGGDIAEARRALSWIVGRDTERLDESAIRRAVIETVSENLSDGVVAPLFFLVLGGAPAMAAYKAVNTLDSMVGYRNDHWRDVGWFSAKADDAANWIPARLTALFVVLGAALMRLNASAAWRVARRDATSQPSPNAGWPEAAFAGALGVRLGGESSYQAVVSRKASLNPEGRPPDRRASAQSRKLLYATALTAALAAVAAIAWGA